MAASAPANRDVLFAFLQYLEEHNLNQTARTLEMESGIYFNLDYFESLVLNGEFDTADVYLSGFITAYENELSTKTYFELRKLKFIEEMYRDDEKVEDGLKDQPMDLQNDELIDYQSNEENSGLELFDARTHDILVYYPGVKAARQMVMNLLRTLLHDNPVVCDKMQRPSINPEVQMNSIWSGGPQASLPSEASPAPMEAESNEMNPPASAEIDTQMDSEK